MQCLEKLPEQLHLCGLFQSTGLKDKIFFTVCSALYIQLYHLHLLHFRNLVLFQDAQNLLEFDPNFEIALNLPFLGKKKKKQNFYIWWLCICFFRADKWCCNCSQETPPYKLHPSQATLFYICSLRNKFYYLHFYRHQLHFSADDRQIPPWPVSYRLTLYEPSSSLAWEI